VCDESKLLRFTAMKDRAIVASCGTRRIPINGTVQSVISGWLPSPDRDPIGTGMRHMGC
jgi:hypothetical protein